MYMLLLTLPNIKTVNLQTINLQLCNLTNLLNLMMQDANINVNNVNICTCNKMFDDHSVNELWNRFVNYVWSHLCCKSVSMFINPKSKYCLQTFHHLQLKTSPKLANYCNKNTVKSWWKKWSWKWKFLKTPNLWTYSKKDPLFKNLKTR